VSIIRRQQIYFRNQQAAAGQPHPSHLPLPDVLRLVIDSFTGATERHIEVSVILLNLLHQSRILMWTFVQVGDGLEIFVVLAQGRAAPELEHAPGVQELSATPGGERVFIVRRELKKD
jgi:20S proteasome subunit beta 6